MSKLITVAALSIIVVVFLAHIASSIAMAANLCIN